MTNHQPVTSSGYLSATTQVVAGSGANGANSTTGPGGYIHGIELIPDGTNASAVIVYNSDAATSGLEVGSLAVGVTTVTPQNIIFNNPICCPKGIRAVLSGTGGKVIIYYSIGI